MSEAVRAVIDFGFKKLDLRRIEAGVYDGNEGSEKILVNAGFSYEGTAR
jgi:[ribosomal protein S5]-alanine N-acetyltransferase